MPKKLSKNNYKKSKSQKRQKVRSYRKQKGKKTKRSQKNKRGVGVRSSRNQNIFIGEVVSGMKEELDKLNDEGHLHAKTFELFDKDENMRQFVVDFNDLSDNLYSQDKLKELLGFYNYVTMVNFVESDLKVNTKTDYYNCVKENEIIETIVKDLLKKRRNLSPTEITKIVIEDYTCEDFI